MLVAGQAVAAPPAVVATAQAAAGLATPGAETIRFTAIQPEGRGATIYEATRGPHGATRTIVDLTSAPGGAWSVVARETRPLAGETLDYFGGLIDAAVRRARARLPDGTGLSCPTGPDYYAEHGPAGVAGCGAEGDVPAIARGMGLAEAVSP